MKRAGQGYLEGEVSRDHRVEDYTERPDSGLGLRNQVYGFWGLGLGSGVQGLGFRDSCRDIGLPKTYDPPPYSLIPKPLKRTPNTLLPQT